MKKSLVFLHSLVSLLYEYFQKHFYISYLIFVFIILWMYWNQHIYIERRLRAVQRESQKPTRNIMTEKPLAVTLLNNYDTKQNTWEQHLRHATAHTVQCINLHMIEKPCNRDQQISNDSLSNHMIDTHVTKNCGCKRIQLDVDRVREIPCLITNVKDISSFAMNMSKDTIHRRLNFVSNSYSSSHFSAILSNSIESSTLKTNSYAFFYLCLYFLSEEWFFTPYMVRPFNLSVWCSYREFYMERKKKDSRGSYYFEPCFNDIISSFFFWIGHNFIVTSHMAQYGLKKNVASFKKHRGQGNLEFFMVLIRDIHLLA